MIPNINPTGNLYVTIDGRCNEFYPIIPKTIESDESSNETVDFVRHFDRNRSMTFEVQPTNGFTVADLSIVFLGLCTAEQVQSNNWRKLHNLPMKRRKHESH